MLKLPTIIALFVCFVYCNNEHNIDTQVPSSELHIVNKHNEENQNTFQTIKGHYVEEKQSSKPCKGNKRRHFDSQDNEKPDQFESLPLTATLEQVNTASIGDKIITSSVHGANYNYKNENTDTETEQNDSPHNCDCDSCVLEADKKVLQFESMELGGKSYPYSNTPTDIKTAKVADLTGSNSTPLIKVIFDDFVSDDGNTDHKIGESDPLNTNTSENDMLNTNTDESGPLNINSVDSVPLKFDHVNPCHKESNVNTRRSKCGKTNLPENFASEPSTRRIIPGIINNPTNQELEDNKLFQDGPKLTSDEMGIQQNWNDNLALPVKINNPKNLDSEDHLLYQDSPQLDTRLNDEPDAENRNSYFPNIQKLSNNYDIDLVHNMNVNAEPQQELSQEGPFENQLIEPTKGRGIYDMKETGVMLLENARVCYACSTISDPTCWIPDRRTTVKYCRKGHKSCLTKTFKHKGKAVIVRDCGSNCVNLPSGAKNYNSCSICHSDLCNGAASINIYTGFGIIVFFGILLNTHQDL